MSTTVNRPRPTRRARADINTLKATIYDTIQADQPMTVRQVFYQLVSKGAIAKTENEYKQTVVRLLTDMRRAGELPFGWIADNTRWQRKPRTFSNLEYMLNQSSQLYRRAIWNDQPVYVEVWLEKDALSGVLFDVTSEYDVPLMVTRGYPSVTFLHSAAQAIADTNKPTFIYYFGDHDPSGVDIPRKVEAGLREFAPDADIHFKRVAVLPHQIEQLELPTRPTKASDSRSRNFEGESVEVDAITPFLLRSIARNCITQHIDQDKLRITEVAEQSEREFLTRVAAIYAEPDDHEVEGEQ